MEKKPLIIVLLGKSGSGKGTQVNLLAERYGLKKISSGEMLRNRKKQDDFTGKKLRAVLDSGGIAETCVIFKLWMDKLEEYKSDENLKGIIFDGSPRKIMEARSMDEALAWYEWNENVKIILIDISDEEIMKRVACRRVCGNGACNYIPTPEQVKVMESCPACGAKLENRPEDTIEGTQKRLAWFKEEVEPVLDYYSKSDRLITINGEQPIEKVFEDIVKAIEK